MWTCSHHPPTSHPLIHHPLTHHPSPSPPHPLHSDDESVSLSCNLCDSHVSLSPERHHQITTEPCTKEQGKREGREEGGEGRGERGEKGRREGREKRREHLERVLHCMIKLTKHLWFPVVRINPTNIGDHTHILSTRYCCCSLVHQIIPLLVLQDYIIITSSPMTSHISVPFS